MGKKEEKQAKAEVCPVCGNAIDDCCVCCPECGHVCALNAEELYCPVCGPVKPAENATKP